MGSTSASNPDSEIPSIPDSSRWPHIELKAFSVRSEPRIGVLKFVGDYEMSLLLFEGRDLQAPVKTFLQRGYRYVVLDLSETKCFDHPYGPGPILECRDATTKAGGSYRIVTTRWLDEWMKLIGFDQFLGEFVANSLRDAVRELKAEIAKRDQQAPGDIGAP